MRFTDPEIGAVLLLASAESYLWQMYGVEYGNGQTPQEVIDACAILACCGCQIKLCHEHSLEGTMRKVTQSYQSPMNAYLWKLTLDCGHERWVSGVKPPKRAACRWCDEAVIKQVKQAKERI